MSKKSKKHDPPELGTDIGDREVISILGFGLDWPEIVRSVHGIAVRTHDDPEQGHDEQ